MGKGSLVCNSFGWQFCWAGHWHARLQRDVECSLCLCSLGKLSVSFFFLCKVSNVMLFLLVSYSYDKLQWLKCTAMVVTPWGCTEELRWKKVKWKFKNCNLNLDSKVLYLCNKLIIPPTRLNSPHIHPPLLLLIIIWQWVTTKKQNGNKIVTNKYAWVVPTTWENDNKWAPGSKCD